MLILNVLLAIIAVNIVINVLHLVVGILVLLGITSLKTVSVSE